MSVRKTDLFIVDIERQFEWYLVKAGREIADRYLKAVEATCELLAEHPQLGPCARFRHPRLRRWRFFVVFRPFQKHILFYQIEDDDVLMRRAMHGQRELRRRLLEPPGSNT